MLIKTTGGQYHQATPVMEYDASHLGNMVNRTGRKHYPGVTGITAILRLLRFIT